MRAAVGWAKAQALNVYMAKSIVRLCPQTTMLLASRPLVGTAYERLRRLERPCQCLCPPYGAEIIPLWSAFRPATEPMRQDLPQHAPLDRLVGRRRVMPPESIASHGFGRRHEPVRDRREIGVRVVEAEDQAAGADPAQRQPFGAQI